MCVHDAIIYVVRKVQGQRVGVVLERIKRFAKPVECVRTLGDCYGFFGLDAVCECTSVTEVVNALVFEVWK